MGYISKNPQTNLSIIEYYQKLGYKYRNWLTEFNKYDSVILTTISKDGTEVPSHLMHGQIIKFIREVTPT